MLKFGRSPRSGWLRSLTSSYCLWTYPSLRYMHIPQDLLSHPRTAERTSGGKSHLLGQPLVPILGGCKEHHRRLLIHSLYIPVRRDKNICFQKKREGRKWEQREDEIKICLWSVSIVFWGAFSSSDSSFLLFTLSLFCLLRAPFCLPRSTRCSRPGIYKLVL